MTLERLTQITSVGITSGITLNNATLTGVTTIASLDSVSVGGTITAVNGTFSGNVSIAGTLTYEDVTNIDSVGLITARSGIHVTGVGSSVGIGTDNPGASLQITADSPGILFQDANSGATESKIEGLSGHLYYTTDNFNRDHIFSATDESEVLRITGDGNVGIGTNNPTKPLQVHSDSSSTVLITGATPQLRFNSNAGDGSDNDRVILGRASGNNQFIGGSVDGDAILRSATSKKVMIGYGTTEIAQFNSSGLKFKTSGMGIDFSATSDGYGSTSELLDDYEEGTWDPRYNTTNNNIGTVSYDTNNSTGIYVKVGKKVFISLVMRTTGISGGTGTGTVTITGLPFVPDNSIAPRSVCVIGEVGDFGGWSTSPSNSNPPTVWGQNYIKMRVASSSLSTGNPGNFLMLSGTYTVQ